MLERCCIAAMVVSLCGGAMAGEQVRARKTRTISVTNQPIFKSLLPDDDIVVIAPFGESLAGMYDLPPPALFERTIRDGLRTIALVEVGTVSGVVTDRGTQIRTRFVGRVVEVISRSTTNKDAENIVAGRPLECRVHGGEVAINGVVVRTASAVDYPYPARYVMFFDGLTGDNGWNMGLSPPLLVTGDALTPVPPAKSMFTGLSLPDIRRLAASAR